MENNNMYIDSYNGLNDNCINSFHRTNSFQGCPYMTAGMNQRANIIPCNFQYSPLVRSINPFSCSMLLEDDNSMGGLIPEGIAFRTVKLEEIRD
jgi:hypothetical protein